MSHALGDAYINYDRAFDEVLAWRPLVPGD
jgi:hypothetical protein